MANKHRVKKLEDHISINEDIIDRMEVSFIETDGSCHSRMVSDLIDGEWVEHNEILIDGEWVIDEK